LGGYDIDSAKSMVEKMYLNSKEPQTEQKTANTFDAFWSSTNNSKLYENKQITVAILRQLAKEAWLAAQAHAVETVYCACGHTLSQHTSGNRGRCCYAGCPCFEFMKGNTSTAEHASRSKSTTPTPEPPQSPNISSITGKHPDGTDSHTGKSDKGQYDNGSVWRKWVDWYDKMRTYASPSSKPFRCK
jgi:hypothetical protein